MGVLSIIEKTLNTEIAPMVYVMMFVNVIIGFCFLTGLGMGGAGIESVLYNAGVLLNKAIWGGILMSTASTAFIGMIIKNPSMMQLGGIAGFMVWLFASISLFMNGHWYVLSTVALFHLLFHGYVYLATTTGHIFREPIYSGR